MTLVAVQPWQGSNLNLTEIPPCNFVLVRSALFRLNDFLQMLKLLDDSHPDTGRSVIGYDIAIEVERGLCFLDLVLPQQAVRCVREIEHAAEVNDWKCDHHQRHRVVVQEVARCEANEYSQIGGQYHHRAQCATDPERGV